MTGSIDVRMVVRVTQASPCTGAYAVLVPEDRTEAKGVSNVRVTGIGLERGVYRVRLERVDDA